MDGWSLSFCGEGGEDWYCKVSKVKYRGVGYLGVGWMG